VRSLIAVMLRGAVTIPGYYWKYNGEKTAVSIKWKVWFLYTTKQPSEVCKVSSGVNSRHGQLMIVACWKCGKVSSK